MRNLILKTLLKIMLPMKKRKNLIYLLTKQTILRRVTNKKKNIKIMKTPIMFNLIIIKKRL